MNESHDKQNHAPSQNLQIWMCRGCQAVHFKTGSVMLNFTKTEFAEMTHAVLDIYSEEFGGLDFYKMLDARSQKDEILLSEVIG